MSFFFLIGGDWGGISHSCGPLVSARNMWYAWCLCSGIHFEVLKRPEIIFLKATWLNFIFSKAIKTKNGVIRIQVKDFRRSEPNTFRYLQEVGHKNIIFITYLFIFLFLFPTDLKSYIVTSRAVYGYRYKTGRKSVTLPATEVLCAYACAPLRWAGVRRW